MTTAIGSYATLALVKERLSGTFDATDDALLGKLCDQVNQWIEGPQGCGRVLAPQSSAVYTFDGDGGRSLWIDVQSVSLIQIAPSTGEPLVTIPAADYILRPHAQHRAPGWPATRIELSPVATGGYYVFPRGYSNVAVTMVAGWPAIPDDVIGVALTMVVRAWHARQSGQTDIVGNDETGAPIVSRLLSLDDRQTLWSYQTRSPMVIVGDGPMGDW